MTTVVLILFGVAAVFMVLLQGLTWLQARRPPTGCGCITFMPPIAAPCRAMMLLVEQLGVHHRNLIKLDVAESHTLAQGFGVTAMPSFIQVVDGIIRQVKLGGQSEALGCGTCCNPHPERRTPHERF